MKILFAIIKTAVICILIYKSLFYAFLFVVSGLWIVTALLLILFAYLCKSLLTEFLVLNNFYKSFKHFEWREKLPKIKFKTKISKRFFPETV
ncbi:MAG: hypothetical protein EOP43_07470 [Sphingobacteriaceae bacterium]|nr:MAG: hypothetical protein EOP43_07470 [Sphingobacteriaceae bacterium]